MSKWYFLLIISLFTQFALQAQELDSIRIRQISTGVYVHGESMSEKLLNGNQGYGIEVGAFQERKLLGQVYFSYGAGAQYRNYNDTGILVDTTPNTDTAIITHFYDVSHDELKLSTHASIRFNYVTNPNIYLIVGVGPEVTFRQQLSNDFQETRFIDDEFITFATQTSPAFPVDENEFKISGVNFRFDLGIGIELKKFNFEIINRSTNVQGFGLRIRYKFDTLTY